MAICKSSASQLRLGFFETYRDFSRYLWLFVIFVDFSIFFSIFTKNNGFLQISRSRFYFPTFFVYILCFKMGKKCGKFNFFSKSLNKNINYLKKSWLSRFMLMVSISLDDLDKNLDAAKSRLKSLDFKNLDREKKIWSWLSRKSWHFKEVGLDTKDILDLDLKWCRLSRPSGLSRIYYNLKITKYLML